MKDKPPAEVSPQDAAADVSPDLICGHKHTLECLFSEEEKEIWPAVLFPVSCFC